MSKKRPDLDDDESRIEKDLRAINHRLSVTQVPEGLNSLRKSIQTTQAAQKMSQNLRKSMQPAQAAQQSVSFGQDSITDYDPEEIRSKARQTILAVGAAKRSESAPVGDRKSVAKFLGSDDTLQDKKYVAQADLIRPSPRSGGLKNPASMLLKGKATNLRGGNLSSRPTTPGDTAREVHWDDPPSRQASSRPSSVPASSRKSVHQEQEQQKGAASKKSFFGEHQSAPRKSTREQRKSQAHSSSAPDSDNASPKGSGDRFLGVVQDAYAAESKRVKDAMSAGAAAAMQTRKSRARISPMKNVIKLMPGMQNQTATTKKEAIEHFTRCEKHTYKAMTKKENYRSAHYGQEMRQQLLGTALDIWSKSHLPTARSTGLNAGLNASITSERQDVGKTSQCFSVLKDMLLSNRPEAVPERKFVLHQDLGLGMEKTPGELFDYYNAISLEKQMQRSRSSPGRFTLSSQRSFGSQYSVGFHEQAKYQEGPRECLRRLSIENFPSNVTQELASLESRPDPQELLRRMTQAHTPLQGHDEDAQSQGSSQSSKRSSRLSLRLQKYRQRRQSQLLQGPAAAPKQKEMQEKELKDQEKPQPEQPPPSSPRPSELPAQEKKEKRKTIKKSTNRQSKWFTAEINASRDPDHKIKDPSLRSRKSIRKSLAISLKDPQHHDGQDSEDSEGAIPELQNARPSFVDPFLEQFTRTIRRGAIRSDMDHKDILRAARPDELPPVEFLEAVGDPRASQIAQLVDRGTPRSDSSGGAPRGSSSPRQGRGRRSRRKRVVESEDGSDDEDASRGQPDEEEEEEEEEAPPYQKPPFQERCRRPSGFDIVGEKARRLQEIADKMDQQFALKDKEEEDAPTFLDSYIKRPTVHSPSPEKRRALRTVGYIGKAFEAQDFQNPFKARSSSPKEEAAKKETTPATIEIRRILIQTPDNSKRTAVTAVVGMKGETPIDARKNKERRTMSVVADRGSDIIGANLASAAVNHEVTVHLEDRNEKIFIAVFADDMRLRVHNNDLLGCTHGFDLSLAFTLLPVPKAKERIPLQLEGEDVGEVEIWIHQNEDVVHSSPEKLEKVDEDDDDTDPSPRRRASRKTNVEKNLKEIKLLIQGGR